MQFVRPKLRRHPGAALLVEVTVERTDRDASSASLSSEVRDGIRDRIEGQLPGVTPFVDVTVLPPPE